MGLKSTIIPKEKWNESNPAENLYEICEILYENDELDSETESFDKFDQNIDSIERETVEPTSDDHAAFVEANANALMGIREAFSDEQAKQAARMLTRSSKYLEEFEIGDYVALPIPNADRSVSSAQNIICRIIDIDYHHNLH